MAHGGDGAGGSEWSSDLRFVLRVYWSLLLGNVVEWYEYAVFGYLEKYLEVDFFGGSAVAAWLGFGVTFLARPFGGILFGMAADAVGRSFAVNLTIIGMLVGTVGQGCLPTYQTGGGNRIYGDVGVTILVVLRFLQGMCAAGEIGTISTFLVEVGKHESIGRSMSLISITANSGFLLAKLVTFTMESIVSEESMLSWAWRVPFILALIPGLLALWGRRFVPESEEFLKEKAAAVAAEAAAEAAVAAAEAEVGAPSSSPVASQAASRKTSRRRTATAMMANNASNIVIGIFGVGSAAVLQYGGFVWLNTFLAKRGMPHDGTMLVSLCTRVLMMSLALPVGWLMDKKGVAWVMFVSSVLLAIFGFPGFCLLSAYPTNVGVAVIVIGVGFALIGSMALTAMFLYVVELFPTQVRGSAVGISYNIGFSIFGGLSPMIAQASLSATSVGPGIVLSFAGLVSSVSILGALFLQRRGVVRLAHVRATPYFSSKNLCRPVGDDAVGKLNSMSDSSAEDSTCSESEQS